jgi:ABC-type transport system involved in multi-copper enzyme maturation permease subunit
MSKFVVLSLISVLQCLLLLTTVYFNGFKGPFLSLWLVLSICSMTGVSLGLMLSSLVKTPQAATAFVPLLLIPQIILGGLVVPIPELSTVSRGLSSVMPTRWAFEAILHEEARKQPFEISSKDLRKRGWGPAMEASKKMPSDIPPKHPQDRYFGKYARTTLWSFNTLWVMTALYLLMTLVLLKKRDYEQGR